MSDGIMLHLCHFPSLRVLCLEENGLISAVGLRNVLKTLSALTRIEVVNCGKIDHNAFISGVGNNSISKLSVSLCPLMNDEAVRALSGFRQIKGPSARRGRRS